MGVGFIHLPFLNSITQPFFAFALERNHIDADLPNEGIVQL